MMTEFGFEMEHIGGISRAWQKSLPDGGLLLITDEGGYDLPDPEGPYYAIRLSRDMEMVGLVENLDDPEQLAAYLGEIEGAGRPTLLNSPSENTNLGL